MQSPFAIKSFRLVFYLTHFGNGLVRLSLKRMLCYCPDRQSKISYLAADFLKKNKKYVNLNA